MEDKERIPCLQVCVASRLCAHSTHESHPLPVKTTPNIRRSCGEPVAVVHGGPLGLQCSLYATMKEDFALQYRCRTVHVRVKTPTRFNPRVGDGNGQRWMADMD